MTDHRLSFLLQQLDQLLLLFDQGVDFGGFVVEEVGYFISFDSIGTRIGMELSLSALN